MYGCIFTAGKDFIAISEHLTFTNTTTVNITIISDQLAEGSEQFILLLSLPANVPGLASRVMIATPVAMVTIRDVTSKHNKKVATVNVYHSFGYTRDYNSVLFNTIQC